MRMIAVSREQLAWAAGFSDGEGHVARLKYRGKTHINVSLQIGNTDKELLERFFAVIGKLGNIYGPFHKKPRLGSIYKPYWMWTSRRFEHAQAVCAMLWHWLGETHRTQMAEMLKGAGYSLMCFLYSVNFIGSLLGQRPDVI